MNDRPFRRVGAIIFVYFFWTIGGKETLKLSLGIICMLDERRFDFCPPIRCTREKKRKKKKEGLNSTLNSIDRSTISFAGNIELGDDRIITSTGQHTVYNVTFLHNNRSRTYIFCRHSTTSTLCITITFETVSERTTVRLRFLNIYDRFVKQTERFAREYY